MPPVLAASRGPVRHLDDRQLPTVLRPGNLVNGILDEMSGTDQSMPIPEPLVSGVSDEIPAMDKSMPIAIVGMGCRFPQDATSPEKLWDMLYNKQSARSDIPKDRFNADAFYHPDGDRSGSMNLTGGHFLKEDIAAFDARFFSISPAEAKSMDPMQRILLEVVYEAMENAGISLSQLDGSDTSCYVGCFTDDYDGLLKRDMELSPKYHSVGIVPAILSNRISFCFNLKGPSISIDTACSSSLVAVHLACQSLRTGESQVAIVGATNALINPEIHVGMSNMHFLSADSICYSFDERANGYARGEGMAALILKPLENALRDGDTIRAVIRGSASNQDGKTAGITLPSKESQASLIHTAYEQAGCDPALTGYFEAHGTGTAAGDPIEASAIGATLGKLRPEGEDGKLYVGSVKTNIGHLEGASGLAGLIKAVMSLERGVILPNIWFEKGNPAIDFDGWRIRVPTEPVSWPTEGLRRASINSFGFGGTNCHTIIDDAYHYLQSRGLKGNHRTSPHPTLVADVASPGTSLGKDTTDLGDVRGIAVGSLTSDLEAECVTPRHRVFNLGSNEEDSVLTLSNIYAEHLESRIELDEEAFMDNLSYTLCQRRSTFPWNAAVVASTKSELVERLRDPGLKPLRRAADAPKLGFAFTGQGAQWWKMGRELLRFPVFSNVITKADNILVGFGSSWSLLRELTKPKDDSRVNEAAIGQPTCTAVQIALFELLSSWGVHPLRVVGHSSGEIAAAYAIGALPLRSAMQVAYFRGLHSSQIKTRGLNGAMMAAGISKEAAVEYLKAGDASLGKVVIACINSPASVTLSGDEPAITELQRRIESDGLFARKLKVDTAYHSHHMYSISEEYRQSLSGLQVTPREQWRPIDMISSVTCKSILDEDLGADYWVRNLISPVQFSSALEQLCTIESKGKKGKRRANKAAVNVLVELGPHSALAGPIKQTINGSTALKSTGILYHPSLVRDKDGSVSMLELAASLFAQGYPLDIRTINFSKAVETPLSVLVDLPSYAWNHSTKYWAESRLSLDYRFRRFPRTDVLGAQSTDWNPTEPMWRNFIRLSEQPWVKHHQVQDTIIYPAAGYICMALEASKQMSIIAASGQPGTSGDVIGYRIRDLTISRALVVPQTEEGVETVFSMRPYADSSVSSSGTWKEFRVFSYLPDVGWSEHCRGIISLAYEQAVSEVNAISEAAEAIEECRAKLHVAEEVCNQKGDATELYEALAAAGLWYGPSFRLITEIATGQGKALGRIQVPDTQSLMPKEYEYESILHPATMDGFIQMLIPALSQGDNKSVHEPFVPTFIEELNFAAKISSKAGNSFQAISDATFKGFREAIANITVYDDSLNPLVRINKMKCTALTAPGGSSSQSVVRKHCGTAIWEPDVDLLHRTQTDQLLQDSVGPIIDWPSDRRANLELVAYYNFHETLKQITEDMLSSMPIHYQKFFRFIEQQRDLVLEGKQEHQTLEWTTLDDQQTRDRIYQLMHEFSDGNDPEERLVIRMGKALPSVLRQEIDPVALLKEDNLLSDYHATGLGVPQTYIEVQRYLTMLSHKYPDLNYLEIGAGTGSATAPILDALNGCSKHKYPKLKSYTYTDRSPETFEAAKKAFEGDWGNLIEFRTLDVDEDLETQGFEGKRYDVILASNSLHTALDIGRTMANVRKLLNPGGKLILLEITHILLSSSLIHGNLPSWWGPSEDWRQPDILGECQWEDILQSTGFNLEACVPDVLNPLEQVTSVMVATAVEADKKEVSHPMPLSLHVVIIQPERSNQEVGELVDATKLALTPHGISVELTTFSNLATINLSGKICISLAELDSSLLADISELDFALLKSITRDPVGLLWITRGSTPTKSTKPELSIFQGLARSLRAEQEGFPCVTVDLDADDRLPVNRVVDMLFKVFRQTFVPGKSFKVNDREFSERHGVLYIKRMVEDSESNKYIAVRTNSSPLHPQPERLIQLDRPLKLEIGAIGTLDTFYFDDDLAIAQPMLEGQVEVNVHAVGLNFRDILICLGEMSDNYLGNECAGVVTKVGPGVSHLSVGDRVAVWCLGCFSTHMRNPADTVQRIPDDMSFATAAGFPIIYVTAYYGLVYLAHLHAGDSVLIHAAAGGVGQAAIHLARSIGAEIFVTVGTKEKKEFIISKFGIAEDHIFSSRDLNFESGIKRMTNGRGVDVVLNSLAGEALKATWRCIAPFGRFIEIGKRDIEANGKLDMAPFMKNVMFASVDITAMLRLNRKLGAEMLSQAMKLVHAGTAIGALPLTVFSFAQIGEAFRLMQAGKHIGKIVLEPLEEDVVQVMPKPPTGVKFRSDASYLLAGGLGGIGRSLSLWMVANGARNLIHISRSGISSDAAQEVVDKLTDLGVQVKVLQCDIADEAKLSESLGTALKTMPPIRGVIQGAMVLKDQIFSDMAHDTFTNVMRPKVQGSWSLHQATLDQPLDFFVFLSSASSFLGNAGQSNYVAACNYQVALAAHRLGLGLPATAIDIGKVASVGVVAESTDSTIEQNLVKLGLRDIQEAELHAIIELAMLPAAHGISNGHLITGAHTSIDPTADADDLPFWSRDPVFSHLDVLRPHLAGTDGAGTGTSQRLSLRTLLAASETRADATVVVLEALLLKLARALTMPVAELDATRSTAAYGLDSLVAVDVRNWIYREAGADVAVFEVLQSSSLAALAGRVVEGSGFVGAKIKAEE